MAVFVTDMPINVLSVVIRLHGLSARYTNVYLNNVTSKSNRLQNTVTLIYAYYVMQNRCQIRDIVMVTCVLFSDAMKRY